MVKKKDKIPKNRIEDVLSSLIIPNGMMEYDYEEDND